MAYYVASCQLPGTHRTDRWRIIHDEACNPRLGRASRGPSSLVPSVLGREARRHRHLTVGQLATDNTPQAERPCQNRSSAWRQTAGSECQAE